MKFCKRYQEYMQGMEKAAMPVVSLKKLKKSLKRCRKEHHPIEGDSEHVEDGVLSCADGNMCHDHCPACEETFFPALLEEMSAVVGCFNERARKLLELHLASGFRKYLMLIKGKIHHNHVSLFDEGKELVSYAIVNSVAMRKILKKYDKIHYSKQGQNFRMQAQTMHIEILHSPWFCELIAFYINLRQGKDDTEMTSDILSDCSLVFDGDKPSLSCGLFDSLKLNIDLTCSICLDTVFDPVSLTCGHIFCYICACGAASATIVDGLKSADSRAKCPLCRRVNVYKGAVHLDELNILLSRNCHEYWEQRIKSEREERIRQTKAYWDDQCRSFLGL